MNTTPPTACAAWKKLEAHAGSWRAAQLAELQAGDPARGRQMIAEAPGVRLDYSRQRAGALALRLLAQLAAERGFSEWRAALFAGEKINGTEDRAATHAALRSGDSAPEDVKLNLARMLFLSNSIREKKQYRRIVNLGTGGSDLGARMLADAFGDGALDVRFVANIDPLELERALAGAAPEATLIVAVSKTFSTQETISNAATARRLGFDNLIAITANPKAAAQFGAREILALPESVGGRYSVWSAAGFAGLLAIGGAAFGEFLAGARDMDEHFQREPAESNVPALMALLGLWNVNFHGIHAHAVLPYAHRLRQLPAYLQQLEMESNGKSVDREGRPVAYATCPVIFGAEGTPAQHAFMQLLHQGTQPVAADFIDCSVNETLSANVHAQADALAYGSNDEALPPHRRQPGNRPSSILTFRSFTPRDLGRLVALYEHKVFAQGVLWNINSFDQWGVELGKELAQRILNGR
ncbi:MAG: glucose-6-phosphate isomerase [Betaproteobacteria bacterium]